MKNSTCIFVLAIWVLLLILGYCWYLEIEIPRYKNAIESDSKPLTVMINEDATGRNVSYIFNSVAVVQQSFQGICNFPDTIETRHEGKPIRNLQLKGLIISVRHGDRGPLSSMRNLEAIKCNYNSPMLTEYSRFIRHFSFSKEYTKIAGSLANMAPLPHRKKCEIGQLTFQGLAQLLHLGQTLRSAYEDFLESVPAKSILLASTPYARTLQSLWALVYSLWNADTAFMKQLKLENGINVQYCGHFCTCPRADKLEKQFKQELYRYAHLNKTLMNQFSKIGQIALPGRSASDQSNAHVLKDIVLTYVCHSAPFPCDEKHSCVTQADVNSLANYFEAEKLFYLNNAALRSASYLRAYGFLRSLVSQLTDMANNKGPRVIVYAAHDKTLFTLLHALGLSDGSLPKFAARFIWELLEDGEPPKPKYFLRFLFNGENISYLFCQSTFDPDGMCELGLLQQYVDSLLMEQFNVQSFHEACAG